MIEKVEFRNFKGLRDVSLDLERFTVLVGPNASGKTSVLEGLYYLTELLRKRPEEVFCGEQSVRLLWTRRSKTSLHLRAYSSHGNWKWKTRSNLADIDWDHYDVGKDLRLSGSEQGTLFDKPGIGPAVFLRLEMNRIAAPSYSDHAIPQMESDGYGLASVLSFMASSQPADFENIRAALQSVVPTVRGIRFPRARIVREETEVIKVDGKEFSRRAEREYWGNSIEFDMDGAPGIPAHLVSEGTLLVLGLLTVLMGPDPPRLVLLDDLDRALHPKAQEQVVALLRELLARNPDMQIVATSHSPYLLHHLQPEEVRLTALKEDGSVVCGRLEDHPQFEKWKEEMTPGEMWSLFGEKWLVEAEAGGRQ